MKFLFYIVIFGGLICCSSHNSEISSDWKQIKGRLFLNSKNQLGFASDLEIANVPKSHLKGERCENVFLTTIGSDGKTSLSSIIDVDTFEDLGAEYFKDLNHIYNYYAMCSGGYLNVFADDTETFKVIGSCYATYKSQIYHSRNGLMDADFETFRTSSKLGCVAKDKNGYFSYEERISKEQLKKDIDEVLFEELEGL